MSDDTFYPERRKPRIDEPVVEGPQQRDDGSTARQMAEAERLGDFGGHEPPANQHRGEGGLEVRGNLPPQLAGMFGGRQQKPRRRDRPATQTHPSGAEIGPLEDLLKRLSGKTHHYETVQLPSLGKFYDGTDGPTDGVLSLRPMTGEEEQILATPRYVKHGKAIDMIFEACVQGQLVASKLLSVDRNYLLIYLRGISYTPQYEVETKCPECGHKYQSTINLNAMDVEYCPDDFGVEDLHGVLPVSEFRFAYRLMRGADEAEVNQYRERRSKAWGDTVTDDTLHYRMALLVDEIEGVRDKTSIQEVAKRLPINDVAHLRNLINQPPFGVDLDVEMACSACFAEFTVDMPLESSFFFPRRRKTPTSS